jgi:2-keto-4-pentenoate hydratase/2-oxohepta-3-ene-1,7-dioic acid hydratase in catechol pathway
VKLVTYDAGQGPRAGVVAGNDVLDAGALLASRQPLRDVQALLELPDAPIDRLRDALASGRQAGSLPLSPVRLRAPVLQPPTVRDFFIFEEHATQQGTRQVHEVFYRLPLFYFSNTLRIFGPEEQVPYPSASERLDYELELGCVVGREGSDVPEADALSYIAGFLIFNDWSARDLQFDEMQGRLGPAKGKDAATSIGPWLVTTDELLPYLKDGRLDVRCTAKVNGELWCDSTAGNAQHSWGALVERASRDSRIVPGDVFGSGTVGGGSIGEAIRKGYKGARWLQAGDVVELEVEGIGVLRNTVGPKSGPSEGYPYRAPAVRDWSGR